MESSSDHRFPPLFTAVQGSRDLGVFDKDTDTSGRQLRRLVTVTSDILGTTTEASSSPTPRATSVPTPGRFRRKARYTTSSTGRTRRRTYIHTSKPADTGNVSKTFWSPQRERPPSSSVSMRPPRPNRESRSVPGEYTFIPTSEKIVTGINGLPPRKQSSRAISNSTSMTGGATTSATSMPQDQPVGFVRQQHRSDPGQRGLRSSAPNGEVPPEGSVFNFQYIGTFGFGQAYYALPAEIGQNKVSYKAVTPFGGFPLFTTYDAAKGLPELRLLHRRSLKNFNVLALRGAGATAGLLGAPGCRARTTHLARVWRRARCKRLRLHRLSPWLRRSRRCL